MIDFYPTTITEGKPNMEDSEWILTEEAARIMNLSVAQVQRLCRQYRDTNAAKGIKSRKVGRDWQVSRTDAEEYERTNRGKAKN